MSNLLKIRALLLLSALLAFPYSQAAAEIRREPASRNSGIPTLKLTGPIERGDAGRIRAIYDEIVAKPHSKWNGVASFILNLDSPGGDVDDAVAIGRFAREKFFLTQATGRCDSACVFILIGGTQRNMIAGTRLGLHRPRFADNDAYAKLPANEAKREYDRIVSRLKAYFLSMGASEEAFRLLINTPSTAIRYVDRDKAEDLGLVGNDPSWDEMTDARFIEMYGRQRWLFIKPCMQKSGDIKGCAEQASRLYP